MFLIWNWGVRGPWVSKFSKVSHTAHAWLVIHGGWGGEVGKNLPPLKQTHISWGKHRIPKVLPMPAIPYHSTPYGRTDGQTDRQTVK